MGRAYGIKNVIITFYIPDSSGTINTLKLQYQLSTLLQLTLFIALLWNLIVHE